MLPKCASSAASRLPNKNGNVEIFLDKRGDGELVSSMLLSMATCPVDSSISNRRPFSAPTDAYTSTNVKKSKDLWLSADWSGGNEKNKFLDNLSPLRQRRKIIQANSGELIKAIGYFICQHCCWYGLHEQFEPAHLGTWLRSVDRALILQGWQDVAFINPANLVFLFMLIRDAFLQGECKKLNSLEELHSFVLMCLYISYSYMGNEISYPLKPFITENADRSLFWSKCVKLIKIHSNQMLKINSSSTLFLQVFTELKSYCIPRQLNNNNKYNEWLNDE
uniref:Cyclin-dependent kinase 5 activator n=1 Tax=Meloidogyne incognita TaxID=6306 RepID=A0A914MI18_MELIC